MAYSFNDSHIAIKTVHSVKHVPTHQSSITRHGKVALSVKYVAADLSSITTILSVTDCQICHERRHYVMKKRRYSLYLGEISDAPPNLGNETFMLMTGNLRLSVGGLFRRKDRGSNNESPPQSVACRRLFSVGD